MVAGIRVDLTDCSACSLSFLKDQTISTYLNLVTKAGEHSERHTRYDTPFYTVSVAFMTGKFTVGGFKLALAYRT